MIPQKTQYRLYRQTLKKTLICVLSAVPSLSSKLFDNLETPTHKNKEYENILTKLKLCTPLNLHCPKRSIFDKCSNYLYLTLDLQNSCPGHLFSTAFYTKYHKIDVPTLVLPDHQPSSILGRALSRPQGKL